MCLFTQDIYPSIAEEDIICYKVIKFAGKHPLTPYMSLEIEDDVLLGKKLFCGGLRKHVEFDEWHSVNCIGEGYIHTFSTLESAKFCLFHEVIPFIHNSNPIFDFFIYECIIPKGTEYFIGFSETGSHFCLFNKDKKNMPLNSYASDKIKFVRKMTDMEVFGYER